MLKSEFKKSYSKYRKMVHDFKSVDKSGWTCGEQDAAHDHFTDWSETFLDRNPTVKKVLEAIDSRDVLYFKAEDPWNLRSHLINLKRKSA